MSHKKSILVAMAALSAIVLAGFVSVSLSANEPLSDQPNDKANHHPRSLNR
jgi:hypothetical protein